MRRLAPNRHQGTGSTRPKARKKVGKVRNVRPGLGPGMAAPRPPAAPVAPRPAVAPPAPPPPVSHDPFAARGGDSASTIEGLGLAGAGYQRTLASNALRRSQLLSDAGVEEYTDPATGRQFRLNAAGNPYSTAGRLGVQFQQRKRGTNTSLGAAGMLFDGANQRAIMADQRAEGEATTDLLSSVRTGIGGIEADNQNAFTDAMGAIYGYRRDDAQNAAYNIQAPTPPTTAQKQATARKAFTKQRAKATKGESAAVKAARKRARKRGRH